MNLASLDPPSMLCGDDGKIKSCSGLDDAIKSGIEGEQMSLAPAEG